MMRHDPFEGKSKRECLSLSWTLIRAIGDLSKRIFYFADPILAMPYNLCLFEARILAIMNKVKDVHLCKRVGLLLLGGKGQPSIPLIVPPGTILLLHSHPLC